MKTLKFILKNARWHSLFLALGFIIFSSISNLSLAQSYDTCVKADFQFSADQTLVKFGARGAGPIVAYHWDFGDGTSDQGQYARHRYEKPGVYKVCLTAYGFDSTANKRCRFQICKKVVVRCELKADWEYKQDKNQFKFGAKSNSSNAVYYWTFGESSTSGARGKTAAYTYSKPGHYKVCLYVKDTITGCKLEICKRVTVPENCKLKGDFKFIQDDNKFKFNAKSNSRTSQFYWTFGDGTRGHGQAVKHAYKEPDLYKVCLIIKDSVLDCKIEICKRVEIKKCDIKGDFAYRQDDNKFKFSVRSNSKNHRYVWTFGDGSGSTGKNVLHRYSKPGVYQVCLTIISKREVCRIKICKRVVVKDTCDLEADFTYRQDGHNFKFKAISNSNTVVFGWTFGDGTAVRENPTGHRYTKPGVYEVCLYVVDTASDCRIKVCKRVRVKDNCELKADFKYRIDSNGIAYFWARSNDTNATYGWSFGDSSFGRGEQIRHRYSKGVYTVCLIAYVDSTCKTRVCKRIRVGGTSSGRNFSSFEDDSDLTPYSDGTNLSEFNSDWKASLYPNPVHSNAVVVADREDIALVSVYTLDGAKVKELQAGNLRENNFTDLPTGHYFIKVFASDGSMKTVKFYKN